MNKSLHEGSTGQAYGLDMTDEMLALARENQRNSKLGAAGFDGIDIEPTRRGLSWRN